MYKFLKTGSACYCNKDCETCTSSNNTSCDCNSCCKEEDCGCKLELAAKCIRYTGTTLPCLDIKEGEHLENILKKIDEKVCENFDQEKEPFSTDCIEYKGADITCEEVVVIPTNTNLDTIINYFNNKICAIPEIPEIPEVQRDFNALISSPANGVQYFWDEETLAAIGQPVGVTPSDQIFDFSLGFSTNITLTDSFIRLLLNNCFDDITLTLNSFSAEVIEFSSGTSIVIPHVASILPSVDIGMATINPPIGLYEFELIVSTINCGTRTYRMGFNVTA